MRLLGQLTALMTAGPEFPDDVTRAMHVAGYWAARTLMEDTANAERLTAWRNRFNAHNGDFEAMPGIKRPAVSRVLAAQAAKDLEPADIQQAMTAIAGAVNRQASPAQNVTEISAAKKKVNAG